MGEHGVLWRTHGRTVLEAPRFEVYGAMYEGGGKMKSIRDKDGNVIIEAENPPVARRTTMVGTRVDLTDDYGEPRRGIRLDVTSSISPPSGFGPGLLRAGLQYHRLYPSGGDAVPGRSTTSAPTRS